MARSPRRRTTTNRSSKKKLGRGKRPATGIDIGSYSVKIVTLYGDDEGNIDVKRVTVVPLGKPEGAEYAEERLERQKTALKDAIKKHGKVEGKVVMGFPRDRVTIRYLNLPSANPIELKEMLQYDVERHVPFSLDQLELSFQVVEKLGEHESRIMMVCAPRKEIEPYMDICMELGLDVGRVDLDVMGDAEAYSRTMQPAETVAIVNFGRSSVKLAIVRDGQLLFSRSLPISEERLLAGFPGAKTWRDLQGRVTAMGALHPNEREHFASWVDRLSMELLRSVSSFACEENTGKIDRMILTGGAGFFPAGPPKGLSLRIKTNATIEPALNGELPPTEGVHGCEVSACAGLALRGLRPDANSLNLLPEEFLEERQQADRSAFRKNVAILAFMVLTLLGGAGYLYWYERYLQLSQLDAFYKERLLQASGLNKKKNDLAKVDEFLNKQQSCLNVLQEVIKILPPKAYISSMTFEKNKSLQIQGQVESDAVFQKFLNDLISLKLPGSDKPVFSYPKNDASPKQLSLGRITKTVTDFRINCILWSDEDKR